MDALVTSSWRRRRRRLHQTDLESLMTLTTPTSSAFRRGIVFSVLPRRRRLVSVASSASPRRHCLVVASSASPSRRHLVGVALSASTHQPCLVGVASLTSPRWVASLALPCQPCVVGVASTASPHQPCPVTVSLAPSPSALPNQASHRLWRCVVGHALLGLGCPSLCRPARPWLVLATPAPRRATPHQAGLRLASPRRPAQRRLPSVGCRASAAQPRLPLAALPCWPRLRLTAPPCPAPTAPRRAASRQTRLHLTAPRLARPWLSLHRPAWPWLLVAAPRLSRLDCASP